MTPTRRAFGALAAAGIAAAAIPSAVAAAEDTAEATAKTTPWGGPLAPDKPLAKAYDTAARALAEVDDNPVIRWQYRVWSQTGYRSPENAGTGQPVDQLTDPATDFVSPKGFLYKDYIRPMPAGGVRFLDNAWYFGTDFTGLIVRLPDGGLVMLDSLTTPRDMQSQFIDQAAAAGLHPRDIRYVFLGHRHGDHVGGAPSEPNSSWAHRTQRPSARASAHCAPHATSTPRRSTGPSWPDSPAGSISRSLPTQATPSE